MILSITNKSAPATDLGYLLHKNPSRLHSIPVTAGVVHVFYPHASEESCTAVLMLDMDPVALVRELEGPKGGESQLAQYVNDRPFAVSSFMSVAIARAFSSALKGQSRERPELAAQRLSLEAELSVIRSPKGGQFLRDLFEPLGYRVSLEGHPLDPVFGDWGMSDYFTVRLDAEVTLQALLNHLYVLIPVLDDNKHYWVTRDEVDKLLRAGEGWLKEHPLRETISKRYLRHQRRLVSEAMLRLSEENEPEPEKRELVEEADEAALERSLSLKEQRTQAVLRRVMELRPRNLIDLGCGEGTLLRELLKSTPIPKIAGMDVSAMQLERAARRLQLDRMPEFERGRISLFQGSLMYQDGRLKDYDTATIVEVIEHMDAPRLAAFERVIFGHAQPRAVVVTTPNAEYNTLFPGLANGSLRHRDHRFEWTRGQFLGWVARIGEEYGYSHVIESVGDAHPELGAPTQLAVFTRKEGSQ